MPRATEVIVKRTGQVLKVRPLADIVPQSKENRFVKAKNSFENALNSVKNKLA